MGLSQACAGGHLALAESALPECLRKLTSHQRMLITRRYESGGDVQQLADELGRPIQTLYSQLKRIRRTLLDCVRRRLNAENGE